MKRRGGPQVTESSQAQSFSRRAFVLGAAQTGVAALLAARMGYIAIAENERYRGLAESNRVQTRLIPPRRGWIVDRYGQPMAINRADIRVDLIPDFIEDKDALIAELTRLLSLPPDEVQRIRTELDRGGGFQPVPVAEHLTQEQYYAMSVREPEMPGISVLRGFSRFYPEGAAVGHLIGYVGTPNREEYEGEERNALLIAPGFKIGKSGLEKMLEPNLRGRPGQARIEVTARGRMVRKLQTLPDTGGPPLRTTIDAGLQSYAARRAGEQSAACVVIDVRNGDILAMVSMPCYDPNSFSDGISHTEWDMMAADERHPMINKVLQGLYPPGSTCKPINALALLEAGVDPDERVVCAHSYPVGNAIFHCDTTHGPIAMKDAVSRSCDIYFYHMCRRVGVDAIAPMMRNLGYGQRFDLPFPSQRYGTVPDPAWLRRRENRDWAVYDTINMSIGQGYMLVNPMQQAVQAARIASGRMLHPRLLASQPVNMGDPLPVPPEHLRFIHEAMSNTVNGNGTARVAKLPVEGVLMAGKTGTAQVRRITMAERAGGVRSNSSLAWRMRDHSHFVAFAPAMNPLYACAAIVEHGGFGASAAAPLVRDVMTYLFDKDRAMAALLPLEQQWGGSIAQRMAQQAREWEARPPGAPPPPVRA
ncbi:MAG: penicillin-binding protein 2 [Sphingomonadales bacterium]|jgi:penicillin-binding protein 2|nr:penicillin-binding protein 2 [Sphingomonadales bacterium]